MNTAMAPLVCKAIEVTKYETEKLLPKLNNFQYMPTVAWK